MSTPSPKELARQWFDGLWVRHDGGTIDALMDPSGVGHTEGGPVRGPKEVRELLFEPLLAAFPDIRVAVDDCIAEGENVVIRWTVTGTHSGPLAGIPASRRRVSFSGMTWMVFRGGKLVGGWDRWNMSALLGFLQTGTETASVRAV